MSSWPRAEFWMSRSGLSGAMRTPRWIRLWWPKAQPRTQSARVGIPALVFNLLGAVGQAPSSLCFRFLPLQKKILKRLYLPQDRWKITWFDIRDKMSGSKYQKVPQQGDAHSLRGVVRAAHLSRCEWVDAMPWHGGVHPTGRVVS